MLSPPWIEPYQTFLQSLTDEELRDEFEVVNPNYIGYTECGHCSDRMEQFWSGRDGMCRSEFKRRSLDPGFNGYG